MKNASTFLTITIFFLAGFAATQAATQRREVPDSSMSQQDKARACNDLADKKGLKGDDRKGFMQNCLSKASGTTPIDDMSQRDKLDACKNLADRKNLKGEDRRSFLKDCMHKVNSR